jgi:hypothetical protein
MWAEGGGRIMQTSIVLYFLCGLALVRVIAELDKEKGKGQFWGLMTLKYLLYAILWPVVLVHFLTIASLITVETTQLALEEMVRLYQEKPENND